MLPIGPMATLLVASGPIKHGIPANTITLMPSGPKTVFARSGPIQRLIVRAVSAHSGSLDLGLYATPLNDARPGATPQATGQPRGSWRHHL